MKKILVVDFGSQYTQLIARRLRELNAYSEVSPWDELTDLSDVAGFVLSGGPESSNIEGNPKISTEILKTGKPILGICYGMQVLAYQEGGKIINEGKKEFGLAQIKQNNNSNLFLNTSEEIDVWMSHGDKVIELPENYEVCASSANSPIAAFENTKKKYYGLQFHPEVTHTNYGHKIIENFLKVTEIDRVWNPSDILQNIEKEITDHVKDEEVLLALSGGVDSTVLDMMRERFQGCFIVRTQESFMHLLLLL